MTAKLRSWWQYIRKRWIVTIIVMFAVLMALIFLGYWLDWTGFNGYNKVTTEHIISGTNAGTVTKTEEYQPGKALWDWLQLLIIPAVLAVGGYLFNYSTSRNEQKSTQLRDQTERDIALDNQREVALQEYIDKMSELLLEKHLRESQPEEDEVRKIARVRTLTVLPRLDAKRKRSMLQFLYESGLIDKDKRIIDLSGADLSGADLSNAFLWRANLSGANLTDADLRKAFLSDADLSDTNLKGAILCRKDRSASALFSDTARHFGWVTDASLGETSQHEDIFADANLERANLSNANLKGAIVTTEQLEKAKPLEGVTMPDGSKHT